MRKSKYVGKVYNGWKVMNYYIRGSYDYLGNLKNSYNYILSKKGQIITLNHNQMASVGRREVKVNDLVLA